MLGENLKRYYKGKFIVADKETEGLNLAFSRPWQVAWAVCDNNGIYSTKNYYIRWPKLKVSKQAAIITGFDYRLYDQEARDAREVLEEYESYLLNPEYLIVGHNFLGYDTYIHGVWRKMLGLKEDYSYVNRIIDTNCLAKGYRKEMKPDLSNFELWQNKMSNFVERGLKTNLEAMGKEFQIPFDYLNLHKADNDIRLNFEVYKQFLWKVEF